MRTQIKKYNKEQLQEVLEMKRREEKELGISKSKGCTIF